jgi:hypothetical protein
MRQSLKRQRILLGRFIPCDAVCATNFACCAAMVIFAHALLDQHPTLIWPHTQTAQTSPTAIKCPCIAMKAVFEHTQTQSDSQQPVQQRTQRTLENSWALNRMENSTPSGASMKTVLEDMPRTVMLLLYCMPRCTLMAGTSTVE